MAQEGQWEFFKKAWDTARASEFGVEWGKIFAENIQAVLNTMMQGDSDAFSKFVKREHDRVLGATGALLVPGCPTSTGIVDGSP